MTIIPVNYVAVLVAAIASMVLGAIYYSPGVAGKKWMKLIGMSESDMKGGAGKAYGIGFVVALVTAFIMAQFIEATGSNTAGTGAMVGFWAWLGFALTISSGDVIWGKGSKELYKLNNLCNVINYVIMGAILGGWPY